MLVSHETRPNLNVENDVVERLAYCSMADVEASIELLISKFMATLEQQACRPCIVSEQTIKVIHAYPLPA